MLKLKQVLTYVYLASLFLNLAPLSPINAQFQWTNECVGPTEETRDVATIQGIGCVIQNLTRFIFPLIIIGAVIMIIYAGIQIVAGADNPKQVAQGKQTLLYAIIGVIGIAAAWIILVLIEVFTGAPVTELNIGQPSGTGTTPQ